MRTARGRGNPCSEIDGLSRRTLVVATVVALALAGASIAALPATTEREPRIRAIRAKADAFVSGSRMTTNFGRARDLRIDASPTHRAFLRFKANMRAGDLERVNLLLF